MTLPWKLPVMQAPIGPATTPALVTTVSRTGALSTLAASWTKPEKLRRQIRRIRSSVGTQFCVNLVLHFDQKERLGIVLEEGAGFVSFSWGIDQGRSRTLGRRVGSTQVPRVTGCGGAQLSR